MRRDNNAQMAPAETEEKYFLCTAWRVVDEILSRYLPETERALWKGSMKMPHTTKSAQPARI